MDHRAPDTTHTFVRLDRILVALAGLGLLVLAGYFFYVDMTADWRSYQAEFRDVVAGTLGPDRAAAAPEGEPPRGSPPPSDASEPPPPEAQEPAAAPEALAATVDLSATERSPAGPLVQRLPDGRTLTLTIDAALQDDLTEFLRHYDVPFGALVLLDPRTGDVRAMAEHSAANRSLKDFAVQAIAPSASIFKIVTAAALVEHAGVRAADVTCFNGGLHGIGLGHLEDNPARDTRCETLAEALGHSSNAVFGKLADRRLTAEVLQQYAERFGYNRPIPFPRSVEVSPARIPAERLERARAAAGFWHSRMSPLHGALIAGAIANGGTAMAPRLVAAVDGDPGRAPAVRPLFAAVKPETAAIVAELMVATTESGTAAKHFRASKRPAALRGLRIAGKTGSLNNRGERPFHFSWFVGFAPVERPTIVVSALIVNEPTWHIRAAQAARYALARALRSAPAAAPAEPGI